MTNIKSIYTFFPVDDANLGLRDYEVGFLLLSLLNWKNNHGPVHLITNSIGKEYFVELGIDNLWDEIKVVSIDKGDINDDIFPDVYRLKALQKEETPFCLMEYDTILKDDINNKIFEGDVGLPYVEKITEEGHAVTNFIYFNNKEFLKKYLNKCLTHMKKNSKKKDLTPKEMFFLNLDMNRLLLKLVKPKNVKVNYLFTTILNKDTQDEFPFTELNKLENTTLFMLSKFNRESIRNTTKVYDSFEGGWVEAYHPKRQYYLNKVRDMILIEQGREWYELFEDIVENSSLVNKTEFQKGVNFTGQDGIAAI